MYGQISIYWRHFFAYLWNTWTCYNETYNSYSLPGQHDTDDILKVISSKFKVMDNIFRYELLWWSHADRGSSSKTT